MIGKRDVAGSTELLRGKGEREMLMEVNERGKLIFSEKSREVEIQKGNPGESSDYGMYSKLS